MTGWKTPKERARRHFYDPCQLTFLSPEVRHPSTRHPAPSANQPTRIRRRTDMHNDKSEAETTSAEGRIDGGDQKDQRLESIDVGDSDE